MAEVRRAGQPPQVHGLMAAVCLTVAMGWLLAVLARTPLSVASDTIDLNAASAERLALGLEIDLSLADRIVQERERRGRFASVREAVSTPVVAPGTAQSRARDLLARIDVNGADTHRFAELLEVPLPLAQRVVEERAGRPGSRFTTPEQVLATPVLHPVLVGLWRDRLIVRTPAQAFLGLLGCLITFLLAAIASAWWQHRRAPASDPYMLPLVWLVAGLAFVVLVGTRDPLRDELYAARFVLTQLLGAATLVLLCELSRPIARTQGLRTGARTGQFWWTVLFALWVLGGFVWGKAIMPIMPAYPWLGTLLGVLALGEMLIGMRVTEVAATEMPLEVTGRRSLRLWLSLAAAPVMTVLVGTAGRSPAAALVSCVAALLLLVLHVRQLLAVLVAAPVSLGAFLLTSLLNPHGLDALAQWLSPTFRTSGATPGLQEALWALASGGLSGSGIGLGMTSVIPHPDGVIYAAVGEDLGIVGCTVVLLASTVIMWRAIRAAATLRAATVRPYAFSVASLIAAQALCALSGALGMLPRLDVPMPFGTASRLVTVLSFGSLGFLLACSSQPAHALNAAGRQVRHRAATVLCVITVYALGMLGGRTAYVQGFASERIAGQRVMIAASERTTFAVNPRLDAMARRIARGSIYDVAGRVVATSRLREISEALSGRAALARRYFRAGRYYPYGEACYPVVGLWDPVRGATAGLERELDTHLRGYDDITGLLSAYQGKDLPAWLRGPTPSGGDVVLSIDAEQQRAVLGHLKTFCATEQGHGAGVVVVLSALQGHPIVAVSTPSRDPNLALLHPARAATAELTATPAGPTEPWPVPSWVLKLATSLTLNRDSLAFETNCAHRLERVTWHSRGVEYSATGVQDHPLDPPHRRIGVRRALKVGCNVFFSDLAARLGPERLFGGMNALGIGQDLGGEADFGRHMVPLLTDARALQLSPVQCASVLAAATAQSAPVRPSYWYELRATQRGKAQFVEPAVGRNALPDIAATASAVRQVLAEVVKEGPLEDVFKRARCSVAGRTAMTAATSSHETATAWFFGFAPVKPPAYVIVTAVRGGRSGYTSAAPLAAAVLGDLVRH